MEHKKHHISSFISHMWVWVALLILTVITVSAVLVDLKNFIVFAALFIATIKATIVAVYFMHLKFESKIISIMLILTMVVFITFILLTFVDYSYR
ncbi:MAG: cytochrome-c oxidase [Bacteroidetes bacterium]|jgi:cytochrome c oxidase subunit 4|nr:cytochrome-c oxidase [Bacteroidota bacterium]MBT5531147.1 cytochrome-c oxidase [Cytophagia bacterium]MBT3422338.1 cytochrome-c oxidase [Bacteroidota bacterium]MBT3801316.1 cytochrome-c oxidase [Bacteroidota bacterium]MBT3934411.1 cytochrome-c oxidase [Bacteroidota bacterium]